MPVEQTEEGVRILPLKADLPRLFCDFPLLGTELFPFPVVVNNPTFNPTDARDGLFLTQTQRADPPSDHNRAVIKEALSLYLSLLKYASKNAWRTSAPIGGRKTDPRWAYLGESELVQG